jgi:triosephosphate isomerase (TIM)
MAKNSKIPNKKLIIGNWKMNPETASEAKKLATEIKRKLQNVKKNIAVFCPPAIFLSDVIGTGATSKIKFGIQNVHYEKSGAYTGELSPSMAKSLKVEYAIVGHSERRACGETNEIICRKMSALVRVGIIPILCVGELEIDEHANHLNFIRDQLLRNLGNISMQEIEKIVIAYEPVFAVGGAKPISSHEIHQRNIFIKKVLTEKYGKQKAFEVPILYGGAVNVDNAKEIVRDGAVDGLLIGRQSLNANDFSEIIKRVEAI